MVVAVLTAAGVATSGVVAGLDHNSVGAQMLNGAVLVAFAVAGAVVAGARPENPVGWLMLAGAALSALGAAGADLAHHGIVDSPGSVPAVAAFAVAGSAGRAVGWYVLTLGVPLVFPDGRVMPSRRNWVPKALVVIFVGAVVDPMTDTQADLTNLGHWHNPIALHGPWEFVSGIAFLAHVPLAIVVTVVIIRQLVLRYRRGGPLMRQQLRLFVAAALVPIVAAPIVFTVGFGTGTWVFSGTLIPLPFAIGFAVMAKGLYDLRSAANRTLVWLTLSGTVAGLYAALVVGLAHLAGVDRRSGWLPWVAAGVVAVAVVPLRDVLQRTVNRITFGRWDEPYAVLAAVGQRLEDTVDVTRLLTDLAKELESLGLEHVTIADSAGVPLVGTAAVHDDLVEQPLSAYGEVVGTLTYQPPPAGLRGRDQQLLDDLAGHLGGVLYAHRLTIDLQGARERLVLAREEERRRLRRDLHDGLGPALAGHLLRLDVLAARVRGDDAAAASVDEMRTELRGTVDEIRRVVEGLRPPALDELGLVGALEQVGARISRTSSMQTSVTAAELPALPAAVEVAAFRIVSEAITNAVKHAAARHCSVTMSAVESSLRIVVSDDGCGLDGIAPQGHGLHTMRERAEELRGRLTVAPGAEGGTVVEATLPLPRQREQPQPAIGVQR
jgi:signal transduction histidine kinase